MTPEEKQFFTDHNIHINTLDTRLVREINSDLKTGIPKERVLLYANWFADDPDKDVSAKKAKAEKKEISASAIKDTYLPQIKEIQKGLRDGLTDQQIAIYNKPEIYRHSTEMDEIEKCLKHGLNNEQTYLCADAVYEYSDDHTKRAQDKCKAIRMKLIREGFEEGLSMTDVKIYADPALTDDAAAKKKRELEITSGIKPDVPEPVKTNGAVPDPNPYDTPDYTNEQKQAIEEAFIFENLSDEQVAIFARPNVPANMMYNYSDALASGVPNENVKACVDADLNDYIACALLQSEKDDHLSLQDIQKCITHFKTHEIKNVENYKAINEMIYCIKYHRPDAELQIYTEESGMSENQIKEVHQSFKENLPSEQIKIFASEKYNARAMRYCRECLQRGIPEDHIRAYLDDYERDGKNKLIILAEACNRGFTDKELQSCDHPDYKVSQIKDIYTDISLKEQKEAHIKPIKTADMDQKTNTQEYEKE